MVEARQVTWDVVEVELGRSRRAAATTACMRRIDWNEDRAIKPTLRPEAPATLWRGPVCVVDRRSPTTPTS